jgi:hypothetical protein
MEAGLKKIDAGQSIRAAADRRAIETASGARRPALAKGRKES